MDEGDSSSVQSSFRNARNPQTISLNSIFEANYQIEDEGGATNNNTSNQVQLTTTAINNQTKQSTAKGKEWSYVVFNTGGGRKRNSI